jgi:hypothetical protein
MMDRADHPENPAPNLARGPRPQNRRDHQINPNRKPFPTSARIFRDPGNQNSRPELFLLALILGNLNSWKN